MSLNLSRVIYFFKIINGFQRSDVINILAPNFRYKSAVGSNCNLDEFVEHFKKQNNYLNAAITEIEAQITTVNENKFIRRYILEVINPAEDIYMLIKTIATVTFKNHLIESVTMAYDAPEQDIINLSTFASNANNEQKKTLHRWLQGQLKHFITIGQFA